jgi:nicotinate dehydrogenase subunit A
MARFTLKVNGKARSVDADPDTPMLYVLRDNPSKLQQAFIDEQAAQCGYCINGMIMTGAALLAKNRNPSESDIRDALAGNLCRCGTHQRIVAAIKRAAVA